MKSCPCCEGREPEKQPNMTFEEIKRDWDFAMSEEGQKSIREWLESRPPKVRELAERIGHYPYRVKEGAPYRFTPPGTIVVGYKIVEKDNYALGSYELEVWYHVLRNPDGYAHLVTPFDEEWLERLTIEELEEIIKREEAN